jgi:hypothetical protein
VYGYVFRYPLSGLNWTVVKFSLKFEVAKMFDRKFWKVWRAVIGPSSGPCPRRCESPPKDN